MNDSIMIAMSGGVDSAVSAYLAAKNRRAAGVTMRLAFDGGTHGEVAAADIRDAAAICAKLQIPHYVAELSAEFRRLVVETFIRDYEAGKTPNPCIDCNKAIKFGALLDFALAKGYQRLATGHYARIEKENGRFLLRRAADPTKDQTYVLYSLTQEVLSRVEFPLGELTKAEAREIAAQEGFAAAHKSDSQDICFIPDGDYAAFIQTYSSAPIKKGDFLSLDGKILGQHQGIIHYTVGQRKGLGIALGKPMFVVSKSAESNTVTLGENKDLFTRRLTVKGINLIPFDELKGAQTLLAKARYRQEAATARVEQTGEDELTVEFAEPQRAISPGQSLVLYDGEYVVGGGKIE